MDKKKTTAAVQVILLVLLILQTLFFTFAAVLKSGSAVFRLAVGFAGLGIVITPMLLRGLGGLEKKGKQWVIILGILLMLFQLLSPWYRYAPDSGYTLLFGRWLEVAAANSIMPLAASCLGFAAMAFMAVFTKVDNADSRAGKAVMRILRFIMALFFLAMGFYVAYPVLSMIFPPLYQAGRAFIRYDPLFALAAATAGDPRLWAVQMVLYAASTFWFYKQWLLDQKD